MLTFHLPERWYIANGMDQPSPSDVECIAHSVEPIFTFLVFIVNPIGPKLCTAIDGTLAHVRQIPGYVNFMLLN